MLTLILTFVLLVGREEREYPPTGKNAILFSLCGQASFSSNFLLTTKKAVHSLLRGLYSMH